MKEEYSEKLLIINEYIDKLKEYYKDYTENISTDGMAVSLNLAAFMYYICDEFKFESLMDRGSGFSSFVLRLYAKNQDFPVEVYSVDNSKEWLNKTKYFLNKYSLDDSNLLLWEDFRKKDVKFDFILEDAKKKLRINTPNELVSFMKEKGFILWDDAKSHSGLINKQAERLSLNVYNVKHLTIDHYGRYGILTTRRNIDFEKL